MPFLWFLAGSVTTLAVIVVIWPWLRTFSRFAGVPTFSWQASVGSAALVIAAVGFATYSGLQHPGAALSSGPAVGGAFGDAAKLFANTEGMSTNTANTGVNPAMKTAAVSMQSAIANLEARLSKGGGSTEDWELLAKSFDYLSRPQDAARARAHQLPASASSAAITAAASGAAVDGEIALAPGLSAKTTAGDTLFIVAKSVDTPGIPVAVLRRSVGDWPLKFTLDDSQAMMPGRTLSSVRRVTIEARISHNGQALPAAGDLQGSTGVINPNDHKPLKILIDRVIT